MEDQPASTLVTLTICRFRRRDLWARNSRPARRSSSRPSTGSSCRQKREKDLGRARRGAVNWYTQSCMGRGAGADERVVVGIKFVRRLQSRPYAHGGWCSAAPRGGWGGEGGGFLFCPVLPAASMIDKIETLEGVRKGRRRIGRMSSFCPLLPEGVSGT